MIRTTGLTKRYGSVRAVDGVDLDVRAGDIYGFVGANGSGKTTTVRMLLGLVLATSGQMQVLGEEMPRRRRSVLPRVGALIENPAASYGGRPVNDGMVKRWHAPSCVPPLPVAGMVIDASGR